MINGVVLPDNHKKVLKNASKNMEIGVLYEFEFESIELVYEAMKIIIKDSKKFGFEVRIELKENTLYVCRIK